MASPCQQAIPGHQRLSENPAQRGHGVRPDPEGLSPVGHLSLSDTQLQVCCHLFSSVAQSCPTRCDPMDWTAAHQASLSITNFRSLPKLTSIESVMSSNHLILCCPLLPPSIFPRIRVFSNESDLHIRWPKYWSFSFNIRPSNEYSGLISIGWSGWISLRSRDSQESSPTSQFNSISSLALSFPYSPNLTSIHDY